MTKSKTVLQGYSVEMILSTDKDRRISKDIIKFNIGGKSNFHFCCTFFAIKAVKNYVVKFMVRISPKKAR